MMAKTQCEPQPLNSSSPNIHIQILKTDLNTFSCSICWEKLLKRQSNFSLVIILLILTTFFLIKMC